MQGTFAASGPYCFQEVKFGQASASCNTYEPPKKRPFGKGDETMKRTWMALLVIAGGFESGMFGQQYPQQDPQQYPTDQRAPNSNSQSGNRQSQNGESGTNPAYSPYNRNT